MLHNSPLYYYIRMFHMAQQIEQLHIWITFYSAMILPIALPLHRPFPAGFAIG